MRRTTRHVTWMLLAAVALAGAAGAAQAVAGKVNVNEASAEQLALLPRIGPAVAERIVEFREENGAFKSIEDLMLVRGIGEKTFERLAPYVTLTGATTLDEKVRSGSGAREGSER